jgi:hypothetical protein
MTSSLDQCGPFRSAKLRDYRVVRAVCAHQGAPLELGSLEPLLDAADVGLYREVSGKDIVRCPRHGLPQGLVRRILLDNAAALYGLPVESRKEEARR